MPLSSLGRLTVYLSLWTVGIERPLEKKTHWKNFQLAILWFYGKKKIMKAEIVRISIQEYSQMFYSS